MWAVRPSAVAKLSVAHPDDKACKYIQNVFSKINVNLTLLILNKKLY